MPTPTVVSAFRTGINELNINSKCKTPSLWSDTSLAFRGKDPLLCEGGRQLEGDTQKGRVLKAWHIPKSGPRSAGNEL